MDITKADRDQGAAQLKVASKSTVASPAQTAEERAWEIRRQRIRRILTQFAIAVGVPTLLATLYYFTWAADEYESNASVLVQSPAENHDSLGAGNFTTDRLSDISVFRESVGSRVTLNVLIEKNGWSNHYSQGGNRFSRLAEDAGSEARFDYYRQHVKITGKRGSPLQISVRAFDPTVAHDLNLAIIKEAEKQLNAILLEPLHAQMAIANRQRNEATTALSQLQAIAEQASRNQAAAPVEQGQSDPSDDPSEQAAALAKARTHLAEQKAIVAKLQLHIDGQRRYLSIVSPPSTPDEARYPKRVWGIATVFVIALTFMGILGLLLGTIREHAKV